MSDGNLDELLASPLDDEPMRRSWWPLVVGVLAGAVAVSGLFMVIGDGSIGDEPSVASSASSASSVPSTTVTIPDEAPAVVEPPLFPWDYEAISDTEALKPHHVVRIGDQVVVSMTSSYARGLDPETEPLFLGGSWVLDTASGETIESDGTVFNERFLGSLSAVFTGPSGIDIQPERLRLVERWDPVESLGVVRIPVDEWPYLLDEPLSVPFEGYSLRFDSLILDPSGGEAVWTIEGDSQPHGTVWVEVEMRGHDGSKIATAEPWFSPPRTFGFGDTPEVVGFQIIPGRIVLNTINDMDAFGDELSQVKELMITATVTTAEPVPIDDVSFDLAELPVQNG